MQIDTFIQLLVLINYCVMCSFTCVMHFPNVNTCSRLIHRNDLTFTDVENWKQRLSLCGQSSLQPMRFLPSYCFLCLFFFSFHLLNLSCSLYWRLQKKITVASLGTVWEGGERNGPHIFSLPQILGNCASSHLFFFILFTHTHIYTSECE